MIKPDLRSLILTLALGLSGWLLAPAAVQADAPGLQASPLHYQDALTPGHVKTGYIEVANPSDGAMTIQTSVQGFRQIGTGGQLEFFDDPELAAGITTDLKTFELGAREAIRVGFIVNPAKLPAGGIYAAIFFRTIPAPGSAGTSYVSESANIGTLLELTNGPAGPHQGQITKLNLPFWQFGRGLGGNLDYQNTDRSSAPQGFRPALTVGITPWGNPPHLATGLVLPGYTRHFEFSRGGSYFGLLPVSVTDTDTQRVTTQWVFAVTGFWQWVVLVVVLVLVMLAFPRPRRVFGQLRRRAQSVRLPQLKFPAKPKPQAGPAHPAAAAPILPAVAKLHPEDHPDVTQEFVATMLRPYGVTQFAYDPAQSGIENTTLLVYAEAAELVVRIYRHGRATRTTIETELEFMRRLAAAHIPVPTVRQHVLGEPAGESIGEASDGHRTWYYIVMDRVPGEHPRSYTHELIAELATFQARMHEVGRAFAEETAPKAAPLRELKETVTAQIDRAAITDPEALAFLDRAAAYRVKLPKKLPTGYLHLDYDKDNVLEHGGAVSAILDFDDLALAPRAVCLGYTLLDVIAATDDLAKVREYLANYVQVSPLQPAELERLASVMLFRHYMVTTIAVLLHGVNQKTIGKAIRLEQVLIGLTPNDLTPDPAP